jgi:FixJ family two-component response regulator
LLRAVGYEVRVYASGGDFLLNRQPDLPGCVILDVRMPGPSGLDLQEAFARSGDSIPIVFLSGHGDIPTSVRAIKTGAVDFLTKPVAKKDLLAAVESALARDEKDRSDRARVTDLKARYASLTPRESEVFSRVTAGKLNKQIAVELGISERTVKAHVQNGRIQRAIDSRVVADRLATSYAELIDVVIWHRNVCPPAPKGRCACAKGHLR